MKLAVGDLVVYNTLFNTKYKLPTSWWSSNLHSFFKIKRILVVFSVFQKKSCPEMALVCDLVSDYG